MTRFLDYRQKCPRLTAYRDESRQHICAKGFTLIEVIVTVAILGILAAIAWPIFEQQQIKNRRSDAIIALTSARQALIAYRSDNGSYPSDVDATRSALIDFRPGAPDTPPIDCKSGRGYRSDLFSCNRYYQLSVATANSNGFQLQAAPQNPFTDSECQTLTLDHLGRQGRSGSAPLNRCWSH